MYRPRHLLGAIVALFMALFAPHSAEAVELTKDTFYDSTADKIVFLKFYDPQWGHCQSMESAWEELGSIFRSSNSKLIGEIDCTSPHAKSVCQDHGVQSYPTIKYGSIHNLKDYEGPRSFVSLKAFADRQLKPACGVQHIQLCDKTTRKEIRRLQALTEQELDSELFRMTETYNQISKDFETYVDGLEEQYAEAEKKKDKIIEESGLALMKAIAKERGMVLKSNRDTDGHEL